MSNWPIVTILICTFNRAAELIKTLTALHEHVFYAGELRVLICDDNSTAAALKKIKAAPIFKGFEAEIVSTKSADAAAGNPAGWAANVNQGLRAATSEFTLFLEDDYVLSQDLDLTAAIALMLEKPALGMLRFRGTAGDHMVFHQFEADISAVYAEYREGMGLPGKLTYLQLDSGSPSLYIYSNGPHLKRRAFHEFYGAYPIGLKLGETEEAYAHTVKDGMRLEGAPGIAILPDWIAMRWDHIGQSYQGTELDK